MEFEELKVEVPFDEDEKDCPFMPVSCKIFASIYLFIWEFLKWFIFGFSPRKRGTKISRDVL